MAKYLRLIGLLVLALAFWQMSGNSFIGTDTVGGEETVNAQMPVVEYQLSEACFTSPQLPYCPEAELATPNGSVQLLTSARIQRSSITEYILSLKNWGENLARREAALSLHREKLFNATAYYPCHPVCEYYIFTLRRILI